MDAISFTYSTRNIFFSPAVMNHKFTGDVWIHKNIARNFGVDENWLPLVFLEMRIALRWINEIFTCSSEMFSCLSHYCCPVLIPHHTETVSPLLGLSPLAASPTTLSIAHSALAAQLSLLLLRHTQQSPSSGTSHRLLLPLGCFAPERHTAHCLPSTSLKVFVQVNSFLCTPNIPAAFQLFLIVLKLPPLPYFPPYHFSSSYKLYIPLVHFLDSRRRFYKNKGFCLLSLLLLYHHLKRCLAQRNSMSLC